MAMVVGLKTRGLFFRDLAKSLNDYIYTWYSPDILWN